MAINLNPGADASLVAQSYRMGMAGVPKDLSSTFEAMADSYSDAMTRVGAAAKEVANVVGQVAGAAAKEAIDIQRQWDKGAAMQSAGTIDFGTSEIETIKNELKEARKLPPGQERRIAVANAKKERDDFFAIVKNSEEDSAAMMSRLAEKNYDEKATGAKDIAMAQAISLRGEPIKSGPYKGMYAVIGKNEDGEIEWSFDGDVEYGYTDEKFKEEFPGTVNARDVSGLLKGDADPAKIAIQEVGVGEIDAGRKGQLSLPNDVTRRVSETVTEETLPSLLHKEIGNSGKSFMEALETPSALSKDIWKELSVLENVDGYEDVDNVPGVSAGDFADKEGENYKILISTFDPTHENYSYEATKDAFVEETSATILTDNQNAYNDWEKKNRKTTPGSEDKFGGHVGSAMPGIGWVKAGTKNEYRGYIDKFEDFTGGYGNYEFDKTTGLYTDISSDDDKTYTPYQVAQREGAAKGDSQKDFPSWEKVEEEMPRGMDNQAVEGGLYASFFQEDDDDQMLKLKAMFPPSWTFEESGAFGWGKGITITDGEKDMGTYYFGQSGEDAAEQARLFNSNLHRFRNKAGELD